jgi:DNA-binding LacI/PurR family transcriptional regulator
MSCRDLATQAVDNLLSRLKSPDTPVDTPTKIGTRLIVRRTTGLPRNTLQDLPQMPNTRPRKR